MRPLLALIARRILAWLGWQPHRLGRDLLLARTEVTEAEREVEFTEWIAFRQLVRLLRRHRVDCVLDVGANTGQFGRALRAAGWDGRLISFEPIASVVTVLRERAGGDAGWSVVHCALGDEDDRVTIALRSESKLNSLRATATEPPDGFAAGLATVGTEEIQVRRLDSIWPELGLLPTARVFLKIDTQGHDDAVVRGAEGVLAQVIGIQTELAVHHLYADTPGYLDRIRYLEGLGYQPAALHPVAYDAPGNLLVELDGTFLRVATP